MDSSCINANFRIRRWNHSILIHEIEKLEDSSEIESPSFFCARLPG